MPSTSGSTASRAKTGYDQFKEFEGKRYTGMKVGRRHKWRYEAGEWNETKVTPDKWEFRYAVKKHRAVATVTGVSRRERARLDRSPRLTGPVASAILRRRCSASISPRSGTATPAGPSRRWR
jgi:hypothetical protein